MHSAFPSIPLKKSETRYNARQRSRLSAAHLQNLTHNDYLALRAHAAVLEQDRHGDKVLQLQDGRYLKLFRRKRLISTAAWYPYAQRFADNAIALAQRGIPCPEVSEVYRIPSIARDAVRYTPLAGETLRQLVRAGAGTAGLRDKLGAFVARLHEAGIYFRSLHLGNIVLTPDNDLGLIDIADLRAGRGPVSQHRRQRNLRHLLRDAHDQAWIYPDSDTVFDTAYLRQTQELKRQ